MPTDVVGPIWGDGPVASSALDLARFTEALFGGELLDPRLPARDGAPHEPLRSPVRLRPRRAAPARAGPVLAGHDGIYFGWTASASIDDATATTVAVVTNLAAPKLPAVQVAEAIRAALG